MTAKYIVAEHAAPMKHDAIVSPDCVVDFWKTHVETAPWFDKGKECVVVLSLNNASHANGFNVVSIGTANESMCHPRDVLKPVILSGGVKFILIHNHPTGHLDPSNADRNITQTLKKAGEMMHIPLTDHIIIGDGYFSFREAGLV